MYVLLNTQPNVSITYLQQSFQSKQDKTLYYHILSVCSLWFLKCKLWYFIYLFIYILRCEYAYNINFHWKLQCTMGVCVNVPTCSYLRMWSTKFPVDNNNRIIVRLYHKYLWKLMKCMAFECMCLQAHISVIVSFTYDTSRMSASVTPPKYLESSIPSDMPHHVLHDYFKYLSKKISLTL